jgi:hypothetical protein
MLHRAQEGEALILRTLDRSGGYPTQPGTRPIPSATAGVDFPDFPRKRGNPQEGRVYGTCRTPRAEGVRSLVTPQGAP